MSDDGMEMKVVGGSVRMERESNIELLRILAMLAIVAEHFVSQGGVAIARNGILPILVSSAGRLMVDVFLIIGCWFMVDAKFRPERLIKIYLEVCFYSIPLTLAMVAIGEAESVRNVIQGCIPFFGRSVWFASAYISLMALTPFLNRILEWPRPVLSRLVPLLFVLFCVVSTVPQFTGFEYLADFAWFVVVYLFVGWCKKGGLENRLGGPVLGLLIAGIVYGGLCAAKLTPVKPLAVYWLDNIRSVPCFLCAVFLFNAFRQIDLGRHRAINLLARSSFAVYIIHQVPAFQHFEWSLFMPERLSNCSAVFQSGGVLATAVAVYVVASAIDALRVMFCEPYYLRLRPILKMINMAKTWNIEEAHL